MFKANEELIGDWIDNQDKKCDNPRCQVFIPYNVDYCCFVCGDAHRNNYSTVGLCMCKQEVIE
jgi:hypothetical protein